MNDRTHRLIIAYIHQEADPTDAQTEELYAAIRDDKTITQPHGIVYRRVLNERERFQDMPEQESE